MREQTHHTPIAEEHGEAALIHVSLVQSRLGLSEYQVRGLIERGLLPATKVGRRTYILSDAVDAYLDQIRRAS